MGTEKVKLCLYSVRDAVDFQGFNQNSGSFIMWHSVWGREHLLFVISFVIICMSFMSVSN